MYWADKIMLFWPKIPDALAFIFIKVIIYLRAFFYCLAFIAGEELAA